MDKVKVFKEELELINGKNAKKFVKLAIKSFPDYFFNNCPASSTGKYHPPKFRKGDGTVLHTKIVTRLIKEYCRMLDFGEEVTDAYIISAICHDCLKQGNYATGHTQKGHPRYAAFLVRDIYKENKKLLTDKQYDIIFFNCLYHYGRWGKENGSLYNVGLRYGLLHIADLTAARLHIITEGIVKLK